MKEKKIALVNCEVPLNKAIKFVKIKGRVGYKVVKTIEDDIVLYRFVCPVRKVTGVFGDTVYSGQAVHLKGLVIKKSNA